MNFSMTKKKKSNNGFQMLSTNNFKTCAMLVVTFIGLR